MSEQVVVTVIAFLGTIVGSAGGVMASSKLTNYRIAQLEKKVDKHNSIVERTFILEAKVKQFCKDLTEIKERE